MTVRELIEELETFARHYGDDIKVVVNRSLKGSQPMYIKANGAYLLFQEKVKIMVIALGI